MNSDALKRRAAEEALKYVSSGMTLGLGTGSTAAHFIDLLGARIRAGLDVKGAPTSEATRRLAEAAGVEIIEPDETTTIDLAIDGTDEVDGRLNLIKGGGGALLREKIIAAAARRFIVIADASKKVAELGRFPLPVEIDRFAWGLTVRRIREIFAAEKLPTQISLRAGEKGAPFLSDGGNYILDCALKRIPDPAGLERKLAAAPGVVETGLFIGLAKEVILAGAGGVETLRASA
jgi:ribose 5-phosphate isomerase A